MRSKTEPRLTPRQRFNRGLKYSTVGPVDLTRGVVGLGADSVRSSASWAQDRYRRSQLATQVKAELGAAQDTLAAELTAAQEVVANLPDALSKARKPRRRRRGLIYAGIGAAVVAGGAAAFVIVRRSSQPEPSPLEPSVEVAPKP